MSTTTPTHTTTTTNEVNENLNVSQSENEGKSTEGLYESAGTNGKKTVEEGGLLLSTKEQNEKNEESKEEQSKPNEESKQEQQQPVKTEEVVDAVPSQVVQTDQTEEQPKEVIHSEVQVASAESSHDASTTTTTSEPSHTQTEHVQTKYATGVDEHHHATKSEDGPLTASQTFEAEQEEEEYEINSRIKQEEDEMTLQMLWPGGNDYKVERIDFLAPRESSVEQEGNKPNILIFEFHSAYRLTRELIRISIYNHLTSDYLKNTEWVCKLLNSTTHPKKHENHLFFYVGDRANATKTYVQLLRKARKDFNLQLVFDFPPIGEHINYGMNSQPVRQLTWFYGSDRAKADYDLAVEYVIDFWNLVNEKRNPPSNGNNSETDNNDNENPLIMNISPYSVFSSIPVVRTYSQRLEQFVTRIETLFGLPSQHLPSFMVAQQNNGKDDGELEYTANSMQTKWLQTADVCTAVLDGLLERDPARTGDDQTKEWRSYLTVLLKAVKYHLQLSKWRLSYDSLDPQFRKEVENFSPVVSTILSYRPPSERSNETVAKDAPKDGSWLLARLAQPFLEVKDIFFTLPGNLRIQPFGSKRLETLEFVLSLLDTQNPVIDQLLLRPISVPELGTSHEENKEQDIKDEKKNHEFGVQKNLLGYSLESLFIWKWNNIVHHRVVKMLKVIFERGIEGKAMRKWLFVDFCLLPKIVREMRSGRGSEGNRGHLIVISNMIENSPAKDEAAILLKDTTTSTSGTSSTSSTSGTSGSSNTIGEWRDWVSKDLEEINKKERTMLGGLGPQSTF